MTPTEQDKELDKILDVLIDSVVEARMKWHKQSQRARQERHGNSGFTQYQSELNDADNTAKNAIKKLITADRKCVELEARIDELKQARAHKNELFVEHNSISHSIENRLAQLKAQKEKL